MENFSINLKEHATKIINHEKKETTPLTNKEKKYLASIKFVIYAKKDLLLMMIMTRKNTIK